MGYTQLMHNLSKVTRAGRQLRLEHLEEAAVIALEAKSISRTMTAREREVYNWGVSAAAENIRATIIAEEPRD